MTATWVVVDFDVKDAGGKPMVRIGSAYYPEDVAKTIYQQLGEILDRPRP